MNPSDQIDNQISNAPAWQGELMAKLRKMVHKADPNIKEEWKWGTGVYVHNGLVCAISGFKDHVKINFFKGALLKDKHKLINAGLESKKNKAIDFFERDKIDESKIIELIKEAVKLNS